MPIYQYLCSKCNSEFELRQGFNDDPVVVCPKCQNGARRLFSPVPIIFKGSGFYVTDNAGKNSSQVSSSTSIKEDNVEPGLASSEGKKEEVGESQSDDKVSSKEGKVGLDEGGK